MESREKERDRERLIPAAAFGITDKFNGGVTTSKSSSLSDSPVSSPFLSHHQSGNENSQAFKEAAIVRHPWTGEYALGVITSTTILRNNTGSDELCYVYVPTNHLYLGDIFLIDSKDVLRPNLSVREGIEIVISGGMSIPKILNVEDKRTILSPRVGKFTVPHKLRCLLQV